MYLCARYDEDKLTSDVVGLIGCIFLPYVELVNSCCLEYIWTRSLKFEDIGKY